MTTTTKPKKRANITNHHELRERRQIDCSHPKLTDQSFAKMCDINTIMAQYAKTGMLPHFKKADPQFIDTTELPSLMDAHAAVNHSKKLFNDLPAVIRRAMDNNPANLENYLSDPENQKFLLKHGVLEDKTPKPKENTLTEKDIANLKAALSAGNIES